MDVCGMSPILPRFLVGKISLAIALAHHPEIWQRFHDGVLWTILDALVHWVHQRLRDRQMLLIFDDAWTVADAVVFQGN
jgi:hypothetical protein